MRLVLQRVVRASVTVQGEVVGSIGMGLLALVGIAHRDGEAEAEWCCRRLLGTRLWEDDSGKAWSKSVSGSGLEVLLVSQFTLYGELKGNKPDFHHAMPPAKARAFWEAFVARMQKALPDKVQQGRFGAQMSVELVNDGPVTLTLDSPPGTDDGEPVLQGTVGSIDTYPGYMPVQCLFQLKMPGALSAIARCEVPYEEVILSFACALLLFITFA